MLRILTAAFAVIIALGEAYGSDVYVVQGFALGPPRTQCDGYAWRGDLVVHNSSSAQKLVSLLGISNGGNVSTATDPTLTLKAGQTTSIGAAAKAWRPPSIESNPLWVLHLDVPDDIVMESRIEIGLAVGCALPPNPDPINGKLSLPIFRTLQPASVPKVHLGTDLGVLDSRNNVAIYNAGTSTAHAHIELRRGCDDQPLASTDVTLAANTIQQFGLGRLQTDCPPSPDGARRYVTYVVVVVDQPSLSFVSSIANTVNLVVPYALSVSSP